MKPPRPLELPDPPAGELLPWLRDAARRTRDWGRDVTAVLAQGVEVSQQWRADIRTVELYTSELPVTLDTRFSAPLSVLVLAAREVGGDGTAIGSPEVQWRSSPAGGVEVTSVAGLAAATRYAVTFLVLGG